ncbi:MAG TPA: response regulator [Edaphocola sp.]|nr:response regulator [Edaphocola sp.]
MAISENLDLFLVDDEPIQNEMLKDYLSERFTYNIQVFENGEDALAKMAVSPRIVILDYHLNSQNSKAKNGVEILKEMKEKHPETEIIMLSGQDKIDVAIDTMKYGAFDYVVKGESAFNRIENIINKVSEMNKLKVLNEGYKRTITLLTIVIGLIIIGALVYGYLNPRP